MKLMIWALLAVLLVGSVLGQIVVQDTAPYLAYWTSNPCIDQDIAQGTNLNLKLYGIVCKFNSSPPSLEATCYNATVKAVAYYGSAYYQDSGWVNLSAPQRVYTNWWGGYNIPLPSSQAFPIVTDFLADPSSSVFVVNGQDVKAKITFDGTHTNYFYYGSLVSNGYGNFTFNLNQTGSYSLKLFVKSMDYPSLPMATSLLNFTVASGGVGLGDCNSSKGTANVVTNNNALSELPYAALWWAVLMIVIGVAVLLATKFNPIGIGATVFLELLLLFLGTYWHIIPVVIMLCLAVLLAGIGAVFMRKVFS